MRISHKKNDTHDTGIASAWRTTSDLLTFTSEWRLITGSLIIGDQENYILVED